MLSLDLPTQSAWSVWLTGKIMTLEMNGKNFWLIEVGKIGENYKGSDQNVFQMRTIASVNEKPP
jgi:hypothetical protein